MPLVQHKLAVIGARIDGSSVCLSMVILFLDCLGDRSLAPGDMLPLKLLKLGARITISIRIILREIAISCPYTG